MRRSSFTFLVLLLCTTRAAAQAVQQSGFVTPGHVSQWVTNGVIGDGGSAASGGLTSIGTTGTGPTICANSGPQTGPYNQFCLGADPTGGGTLSLSNIGGATGGLNFQVNGNSYAFPFATGGNVLGPNTSIIGDIVTWNSTTGAAVADSSSGFLSDHISIANNTPSGISNGALRIGASGLGIIGMNSVMTMTGTYTSQNTNLNFINTVDSANATATGANLPTDFTIVHTINGGSSVTNGRLGLAVNMLLTATTGNLAASIAPEYGAANFTAQATANDGGTPTTFLTYAGQLFASNPVARLQTGATFWAGINGEEINIGVQTGASVLDKNALALVQLADDKVRGVRTDAALLLTNQPGSVGWNVGIQFDSIKGQFPLISTGTAIATAGTQTFANGIDFSSATITGFFLKATNFSVSGIGSTVGSLFTTTGLNAGYQFNRRDNNNNVFTWYSAAGNAQLFDFAASVDKIVITTAGGMQILNNGTVTGGDKGQGTLNIAGAYYANGTAGVSCSGTPTVSFASVNGIVTHC